MSENGIAGADPTIFEWLWELLLGKKIKRCFHNLRKTTEYGE